MPTFIVTNTPEDWPTAVENADVICARDYLTDPKFSEIRNAKVFNLCRSYRYQTSGYYVSLLAEARGHKPLPSVTTLLDLKTQAVIRSVSSDLDALIQSSLAPIQSTKFTLSVYFGRNLARRYERLAISLFNEFRSPLLRAEFAKTQKRWVLRRVCTIATNDVPEKHWPFLVEMAQKHFGGKTTANRKRRRHRFDMAILHNPQEAEPPSDAVALQRFVRAASSLGIRAELITRDDYGRIAEFDALFIRTTTSVNNYTYRFANLATREGLVAIDDPQSIVRCTNKVYLAELLTRCKVPTPRTVVVDPQNATSLVNQLGFPCVLKKPDSSFSQGVVKVANEAELAEALQGLFAESDLVIAQEFLPTTFDWRIGILDRRPLYACKYYMARGHWQIIQKERTGPGRYGKSETLPVELAPRKAVSVALRAANLIGDGLYGVDVKESDGHFYVIEVNDNPNLDSRCEDAILKGELYRQVMQVFLRRIEQRKAGVR